MRNLTEEAIKLAERDIILVNPPLADKQIREQLPPMQKMMVLQQLQMLYDSYMESFLVEIRSKRADMSSN